MGPENLKLLLKSYIECKKRQDEIDGPWNIAEVDPIGHHLCVDQILNQASFQLPGDVLSLDTVFPSLPSTLAQAPVPENNVNRVAMNLVQMAEDFSNAEPDKSIIKFKDICMVVEPVEQIISIPVVRNPNLSEKVTKFSWKTCDKTALSGTHFVESCGEMIFNENELNKDIKIQILDFKDDAMDLRFIVELNHDGLFKAQPMTVSLKKTSCFDHEEGTVLRNLPSSLPFDISTIKSALMDHVTSRTFHMALTHLCSTNSTFDVQLALALELSSWCIGKMHSDIILHVLSNFFNKDDYTF